MPKKYISMKDFGTEQAERIGIYRSMHFGVQRPAKPRHLPDFRDACVLIDYTTHDRGLGRRLNGKWTAMSNGLIKKLCNFGLMESHRLQSDKGENVQAMILNAHGMELLLRGNVDTTAPPSTSATRAYDVIRNSVNRSQTLSNGIDLKQRSSTIDVDDIDFEAGAKSIGVFMNYAGFIAAAYDGYGVRITDVFIQDFEPSDQDWKWNVAQDQNEYPIKDYDLIPALRLAGLLNVPEDKIFYDEKLANDIWNYESFDYPGRVSLNPYLTKSKAKERPRSPSAW